MKVLEFMREWAALLSWFANAAFVALVWAFRKSFASKDDIANLASKKDVEEMQETMELIDRRCLSLEHQMSTIPSTDEITALRLEISQARGEMAAYTAEFRGNRETLAAQLEGSRSVTHRLENMLGIVTEHLLNSRKSS